MIKPFIDIPADTNASTPKGLLGAGHWQDKENCRVAAAKNKGRNDFHRHFPGAYRVSRLNGWLDEFLPKK